jgi:hypothetical protein
VTEFAGAVVHPNGRITMTWPDGQRAHKETGRRPSTVRRMREGLRDLAAERLQGDRLWLGPPEMAGCRGRRPPSFPRWFSRSFAKRYKQHSREGRRRRPLRTTSRHAGRRSGHACACRAE